MSIFSTVLSLQPQLLRYQTNDNHGSRNSPEITLIHRSCNQLLDVLTIGASPLADLEEVLSHHSPPPIRGRDGKNEATEATGDVVDNKHEENVFYESAIKGSSCQWVRILERHQMAKLLTTSSSPAPHITKGCVSTEFKEGEDRATSIYGQNFGAAGFDSWFPYIELKSGSTSGVCDGGGVHGELAASRLIYTRISLTQPNIVPSLLQVSVALRMLVQLHVCSVWLPGAHRCTFIC